jgi:hypothetical protein
VSRFDQVEGVTDEERDGAWRRIETAAKKFGVDLDEKSWHELSSGGQGKKAKKTKKAKTAKKAKKKTKAKKTKG